NNVVFYGWFDTVVNRYYMTDGGLDIERGPVIGLVVETLCRYHRPVAFPDVVEAGLRVARLGNSSVRHEVAIFRQGEEAPAATGGGRGWSGLGLLRGLLFDRLRLRGGRRDLDGARLQRLGHLADQFDMQQPVVEAGADHLDGLGQLEAPLEGAPGDAAMQVL